MSQAALSQKALENTGRRETFTADPCLRDLPEFTCASEIAVPKLLQFDLKTFWPWAPCSWHSAALTVQSQRGPKSILASHSRIGESEYKLSVLELKPQRFYFLNNRPHMEHGRGHLVTVESRKRMKKIL